MLEGNSPENKISAALEAARAKVEAKKAAEAETAAKEGQRGDLTAERQHLTEIKQATETVALAAREKVQDAFKQKTEMDALMAELGEQMDPEVAATFDAVFKEAQNADEDLVDLEQGLSSVDEDLKALESGTVVEAPVESATVVEAAPDAVSLAENDLAEFEKQNADDLKEIAELDPKAVAQSVVEGKMDMNAWRAKFNRLSNVQKEYYKKQSAPIKARQEQAVTEYSSDPNDQIRKDIDRWGLQVVDRIIENAENEGDPDIVALPDDLRWKDGIILHGKDGQTYVSDSMEWNVKGQDRQQVLSELSAQLEKSLKERERLLGEMKRTPEARKKYDKLKALQRKIHKINDDSVNKAKGRADFGDKVREIEDLIKEKRGIQGAGYRS
jgi:hypothetical protein